MGRIAWQQHLLCVLCTFASGQLSAQETSAADVRSRTPVSTCRVLSNSPDKCNRSHYKGAPCIYRQGACRTAAGHESLLSLQHESLQHLLPFNQYQSYTPLPTERLCQTGIPMDDYVCCNASCGACGYKYFLPHTAPSIETDGWTRHMHLVAHKNSSWTRVRSNHGCSDRKGGAHMCCGPKIRHSGNVCRQPSDVACSIPRPLQMEAKLRAHLQLPWQGVGSCAVIGSSGALLRERFGEEIERHDVIIRLNHAPVQHFEPIVGSRTSVRILNSQALVALLMQCGVPQRGCFASRSCCPTERVLLNTGHDSLFRCYIRVCGTTINLKGNSSFGLSSHPLLLGVGRSGKAPARGSQVLTGVFGLVVASSLCLGNINAYGFTTMKLADRNNTPYHYYDNCPHARKDGIGTTAHRLRDRWLAKYAYEKCRAY
eukprot:5648679-Prymnesium_polylepis.1